MAKKKTQTVELPKVLVRQKNGKIDVMNLDVYRQLMKEGKLDKAAYKLIKGVHGLDATVKENRKLMVKNFKAAGVEIASEEEIKKAIAEAKAAESEKKAPKWEPRTRTFVNADGEEIELIEMRGNANLVGKIFWFEYKKIEEVKGKKREVTKKYPALCLYFDEVQAIFMRLDPENYRDYFHLPADMVKRRQIWEFDPDTNEYNPDPSDDEILGVLFPCKVKEEAKVETTA